VVVQTYAPEHYAIRAAARHDYASFYAREIAFRGETGYPPFTRMVRFVRSDASASACREAARDLSALLERHIRAQGLEGVSLIGPAPCFWGRLRGRWRWHILVRAPTHGNALQVLLDHVAVPPGWRIDVDPQDVL
jgi:primosomal protein N' (replication factor Y)